MTPPAPYVRTSSRRGKSGRPCCQYEAHFACFASDGQLKSSACAQQCQAGHRPSGQQGIPGALQPPVLPQHLLEMMANGFAIQITATLPALHALPSVPGLHLARWVFHRHTS